MQPLLFLPFLQIVHKYWISFNDDILSYGYIIIKLVTWWVVDKWVMIRLYFSKKPNLLFHIHKPHICVKLTIQSIWIYWTQWIQHILEHWFYLAKDVLQLVIWITYTCMIPCLNIEVIRKNVFETWWNEGNKHVISWNAANIIYVIFVNSVFITNQ